jgi:hypothetical protein
VIEQACRALPAQTSRREGGDERTRGWAVLFPPARTLARSQADELVPRRIKRFAGTVTANSPVTPTWASPTAIVFNPRRGNWARRPAALARPLCPA